MAKAAEDVIHEEYKDVIDFSIRFWNCSDSVVFFY
jgi:hypothetical protein